MNEVIHFHEVTKNPEFFIGKAIEIVEIGEWMEVDYNEGLRCIIRETRLEDEGTTDESMKIFLDFSPFEEYNKPKMDAVFYDEKGQPTKKWIETIYYQKNNGTDSIYILTDEDESKTQTNTFKLINDKRLKLYEMFKESGLESYVDFLESLVLE